MAEPNGTAGTQTLRQMAEGLTKLAATYQEAQERADDCSNGLGYYSVNLFFRFNVMRQCHSSEA